MSYTYTTVATQNINKTEYTELVGDLLQGVVYGDRSPFQEAIDKFEEYLDNNTDLDAAQKAGAMANFLRDTYSQINQQAMNTALGLMKENADLAYQKYSVEANYNTAKANQDKINAEVDVVAKQSLNEDKKNELYAEQIKVEKVKANAELAKLQKQYGYGDATIDSIGTNTDDGAIDEQIKAYKTVNYKDILKTMDERVALMQNAKISETKEDKETRCRLIYKISGLNTSFHHDGTTYTYDGTSDTFSS